MADLALDIHRHAPVAMDRRAQARRGAALARRALVGVLVLVALLAPLIAPHDPIEQDLMSAQLPPTWIARRRSGLSGSAPTVLAAACCRG